jgi:hypothetical protein
VTSYVTKASPISLPSTHRSVDYQLHRIGVIVRSSPQRTEGWFAAIKQYNSSREFRLRAVQDPKHQQLKALILIIPVPTRWNSVLLMLERAYAVKEVCNV